MNYILFGDQARDHLLPFTFIRPMADIRVGILTIREKWERMLQAKTSSLTIDYLSKKYPLIKEDDNILVNSSIFPTAMLVKEIAQLSPNQTLVCGDTLIAHRLRAEDIDNLDADLLETVTPFESTCQVSRLTCLYDIIALNGREMIKDFRMITDGRESQPVPSHVKTINPEQIFVEEGAVIELAVINASEGPVYIGRNALVMDGAIIRGPVGIGEGSTVRMGARIYSNTSIGPYSKVGGEVADSVFFGYSNKAHDGFLGHSVIGEWCNLAAGTDASNLKLNYDHVRLWDYAENSFVATGSNFCGTFMGDHSKTGISTMLNTGTVMGINAHVYGSGFMRNFIPSFTRSSMAGHSIIQIDKALETAGRVFARRNKPFDKIEEDILRHIFEHTLAYRKI